ncbi:hypothetical protein P3T24_006464, partial [Paraburkholderia sp. GAS33]|uniref:hypothetical protein n=1 Tax=Paraburkholderia sp. GAS33 TaxID=3035130 RepID=UPI003D1C80A9
VRQIPLPDWQLQFTIMLYAHANGRTAQPRRLRYCAAPAYFSRRLAGEKIIQSAGRSVTVSYEAMTETAIAEFSRTLEQTPADARSVHSQQAAWIADLFCLSGG